MMTPLEELQAAHRRLSELRKLSASGYEWVPTPESVRKSFPSESITAGATPIAEEVDGFNVDLIVTLHRTIDAQLNLLHHAIINIKSGWQYPGVLVLARAINGTSS